MKIRVKLEGTPAVRAGLRSLHTGQFVCLPGKVGGETSCGTYGYLLDDDVMEVPDDSYELLVSAGSRFLPMQQIVSPAGDDPVSVRFVAHPFDDLSGCRWVDADLHLHGPDRDAPDPRPITAATIPVEIVAENIGFACLVDGDGEAHVYGENKTLIQAAEYRNGAYGHYLLLGGCESIGHDRRHYPPEKPSPLPLAFLSRVKHAGTTVFCAHPLTRCDFDDTSSWPGGGYARGLLCFLAAGLVDAVTLADCSTDLASTKRLWYHLLNLGWKIPAMAGGDICLRRSGFPPPGTWRTLVPCQGDLNFEGFLAEVRRGRAQISTGPILKVDVDGRGPGEGVPKEVEHPTLHIRLDSPEAVDVVRIVMDGEVFDEIAVGARVWECRRRLNGNAGGWVAVECSGPADWYYPQGLWAHTNPVYLPHPVDARSLSDSRRYRDDFLDNLDRYLTMRGVNEEERRKVLSVAGVVVRPDP